VSFAERYRARGLNLKCYYEPKDRAGCSHKSQKKKEDIPIISIFMASQEQARECANRKYKVR